MFLIIGLYLLVGLIFAAYFVVTGYAKIDNSAETARIWVRLMWLPAAALLWPVLVLRVRSGSLQ